MSRVGINFGNLGQSPRDAQRTRRALQRLSQVQTIALGDGLVQDSSGEISVNLGDGLDFSAGAVVVVTGAGLDLVGGEVVIADGGVTLDKLGALEAAGDLLTHDGVDHVVLPVGDDGQVLTVVDGVPAWADASGGAGNSVFSETPSGSVDGVNDTFILANPAVDGTVRVYRNGVRLAPGEDYAASVATITFESDAIPQTGDRLLVDYVINTDAPAYDPYYDRVLALSPVAYWPLIETSGTTADDAVGVNDGAYTNPSNYALADLALIDGNAAKSPKFSNPSSGQYGYVECGTGLTVFGSTTGAEYSLSVVARANRTGTTEAVFGRRNASSTTACAGYIGTSNGGFWVVRTRDTSTISPAPVEPGKTVHLCYVRLQIAGTWSHQLWINGVKVAEAAAPTGTTSVGSIPWVIGAARAGSNPDLGFDGWIGHAAIFDRALDPSEIADLAKLTDFPE